MNTILTYPEQQALKEMSSHHHAMRELLEILESSEKITQDVLRESLTTLISAWFDLEKHTEIALMRSQLYAGKADLALRGFDTMLPLVKECMKQIDEPLPF